MLYIITEMAFCLLLALGLGFLIGWFLKKALEKEKENLYIESLKQDIKDKDDEWYRLKAKLVKCEKEQKRLEIELQKSKDQTSLIKSMKDEIKRLGEQIDSRNKEIDSLNEELRECRESKTQIENESKNIKELKEKIEDLEKEREFLKESLKKSEDKLNECKESLFAIKEEDKPAPKQKLIITPQVEEKRNSLLKDILEVFKRHLKS